MPLYEYECDENHHRFELIRKFSDPPLTACPTCGSTVHKLFSSPAIQFKGSGFYITDYAKKESTPAGKSGGARDGDAKGSGSNESSAKDGNAKEGGSTEKSAASGSSAKSESAPAAASPSSDATTKGAGKSPAKSSTD